LGDPTLCAECEYKHWYWQSRLNKTAIAPVIRL
jgi:hypothetical protein